MRDRTWRGDILEEERAGGGCAAASFPEVTGDVAALSVGLVGKFDIHAIADIDGVRSVVFGDGGCYGDRFFDDAHRLMVRKGVARSHGDGDGQHA